MSYAAKLNRNRCPAHPGALLREDVIPPTGRSKTEIAATLGISRQRLYDILRERKPVVAGRRRSPGQAVRRRCLDAGRLQHLAGRAPVGESLAALPATW